MADAKAGLATVLARLGEAPESLRTALDAETIGRGHLTLSLRDLPERQALEYAAKRPKGLDLAIRALALLPDPKVKLFVAGEDADQPRFTALASGLGVGERVVFGGFCRNVATALAAADVFLFPSWYEAFSLATIEAAACGLPIVASRISGAEDFVRPGINGEFIEHHPEQIASLLRDVLRDRPKLIAMGLNARKDVEDNYTWDRVARMTEEAYLEYLEKP